MLLEGLLLCGGLVWFLNGGLLVFGVSFRSPGLWRSRFVRRSPGLWRSSFVRSAGIGLVSSEGLLVYGGLVPSDTRSYRPYHLEVINGVQ